MNGSIHVKRFSLQKTRDVLRTSRENKKNHSCRIVLYNTKAYINDVIEIPQNSVENEMVELFDNFI